MYIRAMKMKSYLRLLSNAKTISSKHCKSCYKVTDLVTMVILYTMTVLLLHHIVGQSEMYGIYIRGKSLYMYTCYVTVINIRSCVFVWMIILLKNASCKLPLQS